MTGAINAALSIGGTVSGGGGGGASVSVTPSSKFTTSLSSPSNASSFVAAFTGGAPTAILWSVLNVTGGTAQVASGQGTDTASISVTAADPDVPVSCTVKCRATIAGTNYTDTATKQHTWSSGGGGGGGGGNAASIDDRTVLKGGAGVSTISAIYTLNANGNVYNQDSSLLEAWLDSGSAANFQASAHLQSGSLTSGSLDTWQALTTTRSWVRDAPAGQNKTAVIVVTIRDAATLVELTSATITLSAQNSTG
jgi:hypothetical protein